MYPLDLTCAACDYLQAASARRAWWVSFERMAEREAAASTRYSPGHFNSDVPHQTVESELLEPASGDVRPIVGRLA